MTVLERYTAWCLSDREVRRILGRSALLDGGAAEVLQQRGFGRWLGVNVGAVAGYGAMAEQYDGGVLPGLAAGRAPHRGTQWHALRATAATVCSRFIDARDRWHVGSTIYANALGGRVAVYASVGDFAAGTFGKHVRTVRPIGAEGVPENQSGEGTPSSRAQRSSSSRTSGSTGTPRRRARA